MRTTNTYRDSKGKISRSSGKRDNFRKPFSGIGQKFRIVQLKTKLLPQSFARAVNSCLAIPCCRILSGMQCPPLTYHTAFALPPHPTSPAAAGWGRSPSPRGVGSPQALPSPRAPSTISKISPHLTCLETGKPPTGRVENN